MATTIGNTRGRCHCGLSSNIKCAPSIVDPLAGSPLFLAMTQDYSPQTRRVLAWRVTLNSLVLMVGSSFVGAHVLNFFGVSLPVVQVGGGLIAVSMGCGILLEKDENYETTRRSVTCSDVLHSAFYPLTLPLTVGPGSISVAVTLGANSTRHYRFHIAIITAALITMAAVGISILLCYGLADQLARVIGKTEVIVIVRLSSFLLVCIGVQIVSASMNRLIAPDSLIPTDGKIKTLAVELTGSKSGTVTKAKAAYDYFFATMRYDKMGTGWGRGDALWACDSKRGNCTDFHSPFIGVVRADGIPARFDIGFPVAENKDKGDIPGYHCRAEFYAEKTGWISVDISEAWKAQEKRDYFFGSVDANRVQFSTGRDVTLSPKQDGPALNCFVYPYVEIDAKPHEKLDKKFSFEEVKPSA